MGSRYFSSSKVGALAERLGNALQMRIRSVRLRWAPLTEFHQAGRRLPAGFFCLLSGLGYL
jgi:hypothetical protein